MVLARRLLSVISDIVRLARSEFVLSRSVFGFVVPTSMCRQGWLGSVWLWQPSLPPSACVL